MKKFVYQVKGYEFTDSTAFGEAWRQAKVKATGLNAPIYRLVVKNGETRQEVFTKAGCFLNVALATAENIEMF